MVETEAGILEFVSSRMRETAKEVLGVTLRKAGKKEGRRWWDDEVLKAFRTKKEREKERKPNGNAETINNWKRTNKAAKENLMNARTCTEAWQNVIKG